MSLTAEQARDITNLNKGNALKKELELIHRMIHEKATLGLNSLETVDLNNETIDTLKKEGFKVVIASNLRIVEVSW